MGDATISQTEQNISGEQINANNNVTAEILGGGVILFRNAIELDWEWCDSFCTNGVMSEFASSYTPVFDNNGEIKHYLNRSLYAFGPSGVEKMPKRFSSPHLDKDETAIKTLDFIEKVKDFYLLRYIEQYPVAYKSIWWKVKGHVVAYLDKNKSFLGEHSDTSADYEYGQPHPANQLAQRNNVSCIVYFNNSGEHFTGGNHYFTYLDIEYSPNRGDILFFPSNYMAAHEVKPVNSGTRYSYLGWYCYGSPNEKYDESVTDPAEFPDVAQYSTNVYMPTLKKDLLEYLNQNPTKNMRAIQIVRNNQSEY